MTDPFKITEPTLISFSGGRTSAYMLWRVLQSNGGLPTDAVVCFANTGKEESPTLDFVHDCQSNWGVTINWLEYRPDNPKFTLVSYDTASRSGEPFEALITKRKYLPNMVARFCTSELKVLTMDRYLKSIGWDDYVTMVGIRSDEPRRVAKMRANKDIKLTPLADAKVNEKQVWDFWSSQPFDLRLPKASGASNCDLCFLKGGNIVMGLIAQKPDRAIWWANMEEKIGGTFRPDRPTYRQMMNDTNSQQPLFTDETIGCFCGD